MQGAARMCVRFVYPLVVLLAIISFSRTMFAQIQPAARITQPIDETKMVTLRGNTRPEANANTDRGRVSDSLDVDHIFLLLQRSPQQEQALDKLIDQLNDRTSPNFHHWLSAEEFGQTYGVASRDIQTITNWLESHGFRVNQVYSNRILIDFSGTAGQVRQAFRTEMHQLQVNGESHIANISDPQVPAALAPVVKGIVSLHDFKPHPMYRVKTDFTFAGCASSADFPTEPGTCYAITPQDNQTIYSVNPLYNSGISGQGQTIVLVEDTDTYGAAGTNGAGDWNTYRSTFGLASAFPQGSYTQVHPGGCADPGTNADDGEAAIDVEVASGIAPSAAIELVSCASGTVTFGGLIALQNLINEGGTPPSIVSVSYGECEALNGAGGNAAFASTYQQAASEGVSVFVSSGDEGPSSCSNAFSVGSEYDVASLGITGWGGTPYNVAVGGTDFEDTYNVKEAGASFSTYWSSTNSPFFGSALQYVPEIPWNDSCASALISEVATGSFTTFGSTGICNTSPFDTTSSYLSTGAGSGGASNCATGAGGTDQSGDALSDPQCQGYAKPSWQSGSSLNGGQAVFGQPTDGLRDIPDVSMFAANGIWGHYEVVCWSDPSFTADGSAPCTGAPNTWSGFGGTSVAAPTMAAIQALVNQKTGESWGNPNPIYYQIGQNEYGTAGGSFLGGSCNSSGAGGPGSGCVFNDITQGDIDLACEDNGTLEEAHCFKPSGTHGVDSTDNVTAATVINGGSGYTSAPTCTIAGPSNKSAYLSPTGATLWAGGTQATCTATVNPGTNTAKWTVVISNATDAAGEQIIVGPDTYTLTGTSTTTIASNLSAAIDNPANPVATATVSKSTVTITATTPGAAGNFTVSWGPATLFNVFGASITNTTLGEGPNFVSGITITSAGSGYQPETPITLTGGGGSGAIAVANTSIGTAAQSYQPTYGAAPGWDMATGLGSVNATNLVNSSAWLPPQSAQTITFTTPPPASAAFGSQFTVAATAASGLTVTFTSAGSCSNSGATYTMTSGTGTCSVIANQAGDSSWLPAPQVTDTVIATPASQTIIFTTNAPASAAFASSFSVAATGGASGNPVVFTSAGSCSNVGATYTMTSGSGTCSVIANQGGNANYSAAPTVTQSVIATPASQTIIFITNAPAVAAYASSFSVAATGGASGNPVVFTSAGACSNVGAAYTMTSGTGTCSVIANQAGNSNYSAAPTVTESTIAAPASSTTVLSSTVSSIYSIQSTTLTATVSVVAGGAPTGSVNFMLGTTVLGTNTLAPAGPFSSTTSVTLTASQLALGANSIDAVYSGSSNFLASTSPNITVTLLSSQVSFGSVPVGTADGVQTVSYQFSNATTLTAVDILTSGAAGGDYTDGGSSTCSAQAYAAGSSCTVTVAFTPSVPGTRSGAITLYAQGSNLPLMTWYLTGIGLSSAVTIDPGTQTTIGTISGATPYATAVDGAGNVYVVDSGNGQVLELATGTFTQSTVLTGLSSPTAIAVDGGGNLYVSDTGNNRVVMVPNENGTLNATDVSVVSISGLGIPSSVATDVGSNLYVTDAANGNVIEVPAGGGPQITAVSGLTNPQGVAVDGGGNVYVVANNSVTEYPLGGGTPVALGSGYNNPRSLAVDAAGTVYVADTGNGRIVEVTAGGSSQSTLPLPGLTSPQSVALDSSDSAYITDGSINVYHVNRTQAAGLVFPATNIGSTSAAQTLTVTDAGNQQLTLSNLIVTANFTQEASGGTDCFSGSNVSSGANCLIAVAFAPTQSGTVTGTVTLTDNAFNNSASTQSVQLTGSGSQVAQTITFTINAPASAVYGSSFTVAATASSGLAVVFTSAGSCSNVGATYTMTSGTGTCSVIANQPGNGQYSAAPQVTEYTAATPASQAIAFTTNAPASAVYGTSFSVAATGGASGNPVVFTSAGSCSNVGATYTMTSGTGTCSVIANQAGNTNYSAALQVTQSVIATPASQIITFTTNGPASAVFGSTFSVAASGGASGNPVVFTSAGACSNVGATYTMTSGTGTCSVIANQAGNTNYSAAPQVTQSVIATPASQIITFTANGPASAVFGSTFSVAATGGASGNPVVFTSAGACSNAGATYTMTSGTGGCSVTANQAGNANYAAAPTVTQSVSAKQATQTISFTTNAPASAAYSSSFSVAASASSGLAVVFTSAGSCSNVGATYTMTAASGTCTVIANQPGDNNYTAAPQVTQSTVAEKAAPTISFTGAPATAFYLSTFTVAATTNASTTAVITASGACSIAGDTVAMTKGTGTCTMTAKWAADTHYLAASLTQTTTAEKVVPIITWATPAAISYGTALSGAELDATANVLGTFAYTPASGKVLAAGDETLSVKFTPTNSTDYAVATDSVTLVVNPISTTTVITGTSPASPTTGKTTKVDFTVSAASGKPTGTVTVTSTTGETCSGILSGGKGNCTITFETSGARTLTATYSGDSNDLTSESVGFSVTVNP